MVLVAASPPSCLHRHRFLHKKLNLKVNFEREFAENLCSRNASPEPKREGGEEQRRTGWGDAGGMKGNGEIHLEIPKVR